MSHQLILRILRIANVCTRSRVWLTSLVQAGAVASSPVPSASTLGMANTELADTAAAEVAEAELKAFAAEMAQEEDVGASEEGDSKVAQIKADIQAGVTARTPTYTSFNRSPEGKSPAYKALTTDTARKEYRKEWAAKRLDEYEASKTKTHEWRQVDTKKGTYRSFTWLVKAEGVEKAKAYARKCTQLGGPWMELDVMWDHMTYLVLESGFKDTFAKAWGTYLKEKSVGSSASGSNNSEACDLIAKDAAQKRASGGEAGGGKGGGDSLPNGAAAKKKAKKGDPKKVEPNTGKGKDGEGKADDPKKEIKAATIQSQLNKIKTACGQAQAGYKNIVRLISSSKLWEWANNEANLGRIKLAGTLMEEAIQNSEFCSELLSMPVTDFLKGKYDNDTCVAQVAMLNQTIMPLIRKVQSEQARIVSMHTVQAKLTK